MKGEGVSGRQAGKIMIQVKDGETEPYTLKWLKNDLDQGRPQTVNSMRAGAYPDQRTGSVTKARAGPRQ